MVAADVNEVRNSQMPQLLHRLRISGDDHWSLASGAIQLFQKRASKLRILGIGAAKHDDIAIGPRDAFDVFEIFGNDLKSATEEEVGRKTRSRRTHLRITDGRQQKLRTLPARGAVSFCPQTHSFVDFGPAPNFVRQAGLDPIQYPLPRVGIIIRTQEEPLARGNRRYRRSEGFLQLCLDYAGSFLVRVSTSRFDTLHSLPALPCERVSKDLEVVGTAARIGNAAQIGFFLQDDLCVAGEAAAGL